MLMGKRCIDVIAGLTRNPLNIIREGVSKACHGVLNLIQDPAPSLKKQNIDY